MDDDDGNFSLSFSWERGGEIQPSVAVSLRCCGCCGFLADRHTRRHSGSEFYHRRQPSVRPRLSPTRRSLQFGTIIPVSRVNAGAPSFSISEVIFRRSRFRLYLYARQETTARCAHGFFLAVLGFSGEISIPGIGACGGGRRLSREDGSRSQGFSLSALTARSSRYCNFV